MQVHPNIGLGVWLGICLAAMLTGWFFTRLSISEWYLGLKKPSWTPPGWVFGPIWFVLYSMMAVAAWLVWRKTGQARPTSALVLFIIQLCFNLSWSYVFFGLKKPGLALAEIMLLYLAVLISAIAFWRENALAGWLLLPYLLWTVYAALLNFSIWRLNSAERGGPPFQVSGPGFTGMH